MLGLLLVAALVLPVPYVVRSPGPTIDTLGESGEKPMINISGAETYPTGEGQLRLTTVSSVGGPGSSVTLLDAVTGWLRSDVSVLPRDLLYPEDSDADELSDFQIAQMNSSQMNATAAALQELGYDVPMTMTVAELMPDLPAAEQLEVDDIVTAITPAGGHRVELSSFRQLTDVLATLPAGTEVTLDVEREGEPVSVTFPTSPREEGDDAPGSLLGVWLFTDVDDFPVDVEFDINSVGGPSAGTMFALAVVDMLTEGEMTGGVRIAGTGTMSIDGKVGPIGGIVQKLNGAARDDAAWFLVPEGNCAETVGQVPDGLNIAAIADLSQAIDAVEAIGSGETSGIETCEAVLAQD